MKQRFGLVESTLLHEDLAEHIPQETGLRMVGAQRSFDDFQSPARWFLGGGVSPPEIIKTAEATHHLARLVMGQPECRFGQHQSLRQEGLRFRESCPNHLQNAEVRQPTSDLDALGTGVASPDLQGSAIKRLDLGEASPTQQDDGQVVRCISDLRMIGTVDSLEDRQALPKQRFGLVVPALIESQRREVIPDRCDERVARSSQTLLHLQRTDENLAAFFQPAQLAEDFAQVAQRDAEFLRVVTSLTDRERPTEETLRTPRSGPGL